MEKPLREVPVLSSRAHLGAQKRAVPFRGGGGIHQCISVRVRRDTPYRQPKSIGGGETSPPDLGAHLWVHTDEPPRPPHEGHFEGRGSLGKGFRGGE